MAAGDFVVFDEALAYMFDGGWSASDDIKCAVLDNTTTPAADDTTPTLSDYTEVGTGGTYVAGGTSLGTFGDAVTQTGSTMTFDSAVNPSWAIDAGNDTDAYYALIYNDDDVSDLAIGFLDLGGPVDMTAVLLELTWNADGIFTITRTSALGGLDASDGNFIVGDGADFVVESGATARASLGLVNTANQVHYGNNEQSADLSWDDTAKELTIDDLIISTPVIDSNQSFGNADTLGSVVAGAHNNLAIGNEAGSSITTQTYNTYIGNQAGRYSTGAQNIAIGSRAVQGVSGSTTGGSNTAIGYVSFFGLTTGVANTGIGFYSGLSVTTGSNNVLIGSSSGRDITTGTRNVTIGTLTARNVVSRDDMVAIGYYSLGGNSTANLTGCVGVGASALRLTGGDSYYTVAVGYNAGISSTGYIGVYVGNSAGRTANGNFNVCIGGDAGYNTIGASNVFIGYSAGRPFTSGVANTLAIHNANSNQVLIYGEFNNRNFGFNFTEGTDSMGTSSQGVVFIHEKVANPTGNPSGGGVLYVDSGALKYRGPGGTTTTIAPT